VSRYQKGKANLDFTEARDSEWQWHQLGQMQVCTSLQTDNHASTPPLSFLQAGCPSCRPTNSVKARGADLHIAQLMPLPLTVFCFSKIQIGFTFLVPAHPGSPGKGAVKRVCVCVCVCVCVRACACACCWCLLLK